MKKNFDRIVLVLTLLLGGAGCAFCLMIYGRTAQDTWGRIIWSGLFFSLPFVTSLLGSYLAESLQSRRFNRAAKKRADLYGDPGSGSRFSGRSRRTGSVYDFRL